MSPKGISLLSEQEIIEAVQTTGAITCFKVENSEKSIKFKIVNSIRHIQDLTKGGHNVSKLSFQESSKWSIFMKRSRVSSTGTLKRKVHEKN